MMRIMQIIATIKVVIIAQMLIPALKSRMAVIETTATITTVAARKVMRNAGVSS